MKKEILIFGIICLFIGVGIQPAFANENISINRTSSKNIEDCNCQDADDYRLERLFNRIDSLLDRVEIFINLIPILSKDNPQVLEDFEELSEKITTFREMNEEELSDGVSVYGSQSNEKICSIIFILFYKSMFSLKIISLIQIVDFKS